MPARPRHFPSVIEVGSYSIIADDSFPDVEIITGEKEQPKMSVYLQLFAKQQKHFYSEIKYA